MCLAFPGTVTKIKGKSAIVVYQDSTKTVLLGDEKVKVGDNVLVQMGIVVKVLSSEENTNILNAWNNID